MELWKQGMGVTEGLCDFCLNYVINYAMFKYAITYEQYHCKNKRVTFNR